MAQRSEPTDGHSQLIAKQAQMKQQLEEELERRVREALKTPPLERLKKSLSEKTASCGSIIDYDQLNAHLDLASKEREYRQRRRMRARGLLGSFTDRSAVSCSDLAARDESATADRGRIAAGSSIRDDLTADSDGSAGSYAVDQTPASSASERQGGGSAASESTRSSETNLWAAVLQPALPPSAFIDALPEAVEPLGLGTDGPDLFDSQKTPYGNQKWRGGAAVVFDSLRSPKHQEPLTSSVEGNGSGYQPAFVAPSLIFESRFESGNLQLARRVGQFEYELLLKTDLYTKRHTQWYYFRMQNALPGITYKFRITNFLKKDSLYNYGMKPLFYSEIDAKKKNIGWIRTGHHIKYSLNTQHLSTSLHSRDLVYYELEWQMEFEHASDTCYVAHCYPYTFSDLKRDLDAVMADPERSAVSRREVLCETKAGNSCFLVTVTDFASDAPKKCVVVSARVHPGESNSSWMMKGLLEYITSSDAVAKDLRREFVFKIIPMLNPDGVIIGNYRCDLSGKDLNRNYRWPEKHSFPTVAYTKAMVERLQNDMEVLVYCDLHGHSKKSNVFMYGCNSPESIAGDTKAYIAERLFPFLISRQAPDVFSFPSCKFKIQKKKESTGRVVMYRQMKIRNSFTLESTFCGTILDRRGSRHFNQRDYQDIGRYFCLGLHEYMQVLDDKGKETEVVIDLTQSIMQRLIKMKASDEPQIASEPAPATATQSEAGRCLSLKWTRSNGRTGAKRSQATSFRSRPGPALERTSTTTRSASAVPREMSSQEPTYDTSCSNGIGVTPMPSSITSERTDSYFMEPFLSLDSAGTPTAETCTDLLRQIICGTPGGLRGIESDSSSDSDSESEAELYRAKAKPRTKRASKAGRKKKKKQLSGDHVTTKQAASMMSRSMFELSGSEQRQLAPVPDYKPPPWQRRASCVAALTADGSSAISASAKTARSLAKSSSRAGSWSGVLPSISKEHARSAEPNATRNPSSVREASGVTKGNSAADGAGVNTKLQPKRPPAVKTYHWVNPYTGRTNGGIPCFSERRSLQRAARRMSDALRQSCKDLWHSACQSHNGCSDDISKDDFSKADSAGDPNMPTLNTGATVDCTLANPVISSSGFFADLSKSHSTLVESAQNLHGLVCDQNLNGCMELRSSSSLRDSRSPDTGDKPANISLGKEATAASGLLDIGVDGAAISCDALTFHDCREDCLCSVACKPLSDGMRAQLLLPALVPRRLMPSEQQPRCTSASLQLLAERQAAPHVQCRTRNSTSTLNITTWPAAMASDGSGSSTSYDPDRERPLVGCASAYVLTRSSGQLISRNHGYRLAENVTDEQYSGVQCRVVQLPSPSMRASTADGEWRRPAVCTSLPATGGAEQLYGAGLRRRILAVSGDLGAADLQSVNGRFAEALARRIRLHQQQSSPLSVLPAESCPRSSYLTEVLRVHSMPSATQSQDSLSK